MAKDPAFLFYPSDFLTGVAFLTDEEVGKYIRLLCLIHQHGRLDEESVCKAIGLVSVKLRSKFSIDEKGLWFNSRLEEEIEKRAKFTESRRNNGLLGGRGKKKDKAIGLANDKAIENLSINRNENINESVVNNNTNARFEKMLLESDSVLGTVCFQLKISTNDAQSLRTMYVKQMSSTDECHNNYTDYSKHFVNWAKINKGLISDKPKGKIEQAIDTHTKGIEIIKQMRKNGTID